MARQKLTWKYGSQLKLKETAGFFNVLLWTFKILGKMKLETS